MESIYSAFMGVSGRINTKKILQHISLIHALLIIDQTSFYGGLDTPTLLYSFFLLIILPINDYQEQKK